MKSVRNKTHAPLRVPLPRGKVLHLGPSKTGQIAPQAADHPPLQKLVEADQIEIFDDTTAHAAGSADPSSVHASTHGHTPEMTLPRRGDR